MLGFGDVFAFVSDWSIIWMCVRVLGFGGL